jgi:hypothetical protein
VSIDSNSKSLTEENNELKEKLVTLKQQYRTDIEKTKSEFTLYDQRLKSHHERMVPFADIQQSSIQIQKWKAAFDTEHKKFVSLQQSCIGYTLKSKKKIVAYWCKFHKWCSKHDKYEMAGKCAYSSKISEKVRQAILPNISNDISQVKGPS